MIKSKVNGLIIGATPVTSEVTRLGRGKFADFHRPKAGATKSASQAKRVATQRKAAATAKATAKAEPSADEVEQL